MIARLADKVRGPAVDRARRVAAARRPARVAGKAPRVLIIIQNLPVPFDRRVWLESQALRDAGYDVTVVCPRGKGDPDYEILDGIAVYKYSAYAPGGSAASFIAEYAHSFANTARLVAKARRSGRFDVVQACNPPDIFFPIGLALKVEGTSYVFDHHDLCPELYESRFPNGNPLAHKGLLALEWATMHTAKRVISTNGSYRKVAMTRGGKQAHEVTIVRTGPDPERLKRAEEMPELRKGRKHLVTYIGVMGPQDGVDLAVRAAGHIVNNLGRTDIQFNFMGGGDSYDELVALRDELGITDYVDLPGRVPDHMVVDVMSTADLGLSPDPKNALNDVSTMNKTMEYMSFSLPVVAFDLVETKVSAQDAAVYVPDGDIAGYAQAIVDLLDDEAARAQMGAYARHRVEAELAWPYQRAAYLKVYRELAEPISDPINGSVKPTNGLNAHGPLVSLDDDPDAGSPTSQADSAERRVIDLRDALNDGSAHDNTDGKPQQPDAFDLQDRVKTVQGE